MTGYSNQPIPKEAAKQLLALDLQDTDGLWKPNEKGLGYGRVLDYIGVAY